MTLPSDKEPGSALSPAMRRILDAAAEIKAEPNAAEMAFMARALVQATLPHSDPGEVPIWGRTNGRLTLTIKPDWELDPKTNQSHCVGIPYGTIPRLLLFWITTEAVKPNPAALNWEIVYPPLCGNLVCSQPAGAGEVSPAYANT